MQGGKGERGAWHGNVGGIEGWACYSACCSSSSCALLVRVVQVLAIRMKKHKVAFLEPLECLNESNPDCSHIFFQG